MLASELDALKSELQRTLTRLGIECVSSIDDVESCCDERDIAHTAVPHDTRQKWRRPRRARNANGNRPITRWNRRQLTEELAAASERRRRLEMQLEREMESDRRLQDSSQQRDQRRHSRKSAWQAAILELQQQRAHILLQMEHESAADVAAMEEKEETKQNDCQEAATSNCNPVPPVLNNRETQYSIGGVVTLEKLSLSQQPQASARRSGVFLHSAVDTASVATQSRHIHPGLPHRNTTDALNDVFSLQLRFAETMLKLEKSVQMRDQLLQYDKTSNSSKRRTETQLTEDTTQACSRSRQRRRSFESKASSDTSIVCRENYSSESFSSSAYSFSSLDSMPSRDQATRMKHPNFKVSRATTAETLAPTSLSADSSFSKEAVDRVAMISTSTTLQSPRNSVDMQQNSDVEHTLFDDQESEAHRTPTTGSSTTTPTTGSDQKSTSSLSKQVRFGDDAYSTPMLVRRFNFDGPSIDEDDDEEKKEEVASILSFLGGSSITSTELNDSSFLRAFECFRRELNAPKLISVTQSPPQPPLARKLFSEQNMPKTTKALNSAPRAQEGPCGTAAESTCEVDARTVFPTLDDLSVEGLQERRKQLCLDIQAESAQLVLSLGGGQNANAGSQDAEQTQSRLLMMRNELQAIDARLHSLV